jgi:hypothetical protein
LQQYLRAFDAAAQLSQQSSAAVLIELDFLSTAGTLLIFHCESALSKPSLLSDAVAL